jgi:hypothetical protein
MREVLLFLGIMTALSASGVLLLRDLYDMRITFKRLPDESDEE